jgi:hypothetical protein
VTKFDLRGNRMQSCRQSRFFGSCRQCIPEAARVYISGNILAELLLVVVVVIVVVKSRFVAVSGPTPTNRNTTSPLITHIRPGERVRVCATLKQPLALHTQNIYTGHSQ